MSKTPLSKELMIIHCCRTQHSNLSLVGWYLSEQKALINSWLADVLHRLVEFKLLCIVEYINSWEPDTFLYTLGIKSELAGLLKNELIEVLEFV